MTSDYAILISAVLVSLLDNGGEAPEGTIYAATMIYGMTLSEFYVIVSSLEAAGLVIRSTAYIISLTAKGTEAAQRLADVFASAGKK